MARVVKEYSERRSEILTAALKLVYTRGFESMTIQDILDDLKISKGAFYHYFDSKASLLNALVENTLEEIKVVLVPIVEDPELTAVEKLNQYFASASRWKIERKEFFLKLIRVWYTDENIIVRYKTILAITQWIGPMISTIIHQGIREGVMSTPHPDRAGEIIITMLYSMSDQLSTRLVWEDLSLDDLPLLDKTLAAYIDAMERVIGLAPGNIKMNQAEIMRDWLAQPAPVTMESGQA
jgi:AcrR family transcriptional regulator